MKECAEECGGRNGCHDYERISFSLVHPDENSPPSTSHLNSNPASLRIPNSSLKARIKSPVVKESEK